MHLYFSNLLEVDIPDWVVDPFGLNETGVDIILQECLIELQCDTTAQTKFKKIKTEFLD